MSAHRNPPIEFALTGSPWERVMHLARMLKTQMAEASTSPLPGQGWNQKAALEEGDGILTNLLDELESAYTLDHPDPLDEAELAMERAAQRYDAERDRLMVLS